MFLRSRNPESEQRAARQVNRFRSMLILLELLVWVLVATWFWTNPPPAPEGLIGFLRGPALALVTAGGLVLVLLVHVFSLAVLGLLFRLRLPVWLACVATCLLGPALAVTFLVAALRMMS